MAKNRAMDNEEFKQKLSEVANWHYSDRKETTQQATNRYYKERREQQRLQLLESMREMGLDDEDHEQDEEQDEEEQDEEEQDELPGPENLPIQILSYKESFLTCNSCGKVCKTIPVVDIRPTKIDGVTVYKEKCQTCRKYKNPKTGKFDQTVHQNGASMLTVARKKRKAKSKLAAAFKPENNDEV